MSTLLIVGATGGVGSRLIPLLVAAGHTVRGLHRKPDQAKELQRQGATPIQGDLMEMETEDFAAALEGVDTVVFSAGAAGSGPERATRIDGEAPARIVEAMGRTGARRIYVVSVFPDAGRARETSEGFEHYMACKRQADVAVTASDLDWVLLRPGTLTSEEADGQIHAGHAIPYGNVKRGNVAATLAELIAHPEIRHEAIELTDGETPIGQAMRAFVRG